jgi:hypothetical protein
METWGTGYEWEGAWTIGDVQTMTGQDTHSLAYDVSADTIFINTTGGAQSWTGLTGYTTLAGASFPSNTLTLEPFSSAILIKP